MKQTEKADPRTARRKATPAANFGINFAVGVALLAYIGYRIDEKRGGGVLWTLCGVFLGLAYGAYETWKFVRLLNRNEEDDGT